VPAKETVYRIFREALVNARKHVNAANVTLNLDEHDRVFVLTLTDDGDGAVCMDAGPVISAWPQCGCAPPQRADGCRSTARRAGGQRCS
jgi:hypothetical protein